jgi:quercetin dioxygenase-like cupin family protein
MMSRRDLNALAAAFLSALHAEGQALGRAPAKELSRHALGGTEAELEAILVEITAAPGSPSAVHRHPGFVLGYVLNGEMQFAIDGGEPQIVKTGGTFFEPAGARHTTGGSANPNAPVTFLAFMVVPKGSPLTLPA